MTHFKALELSLDAIRSLRPLVRTIKKDDAKLADQIRRAATSVALNLAEGRRRNGKDRAYHWSVAAGSADEAFTALRVAEAWGAIDRREAAGTLGLLDQILAILYRVLS